MKGVSMQLNTLQDLYLHGLMDAYSFEKQIIEALPKMIKKASSPDLKEAFEAHLEETKEQREMLKKIIDNLDSKPEEVECNGMKGILKEGEEILKMDGDPNVIDAGLIGAAQRVEHYEMSVYGALEAYAEQLGEDDAQEIFAEIKDQEITADENLNDLALSTVNVDAGDADLDEEEDEADNSKVI
jgi:ferritin-like metal-binding protein YciE